LLAGYYNSQIETVFLTSGSAIATGNFEIPADRRLVILENVTLSGGSINVLGTLTVGEGAVLANSGVIILNSLDYAAAGIGTVNPKITGTVLPHSTTLPSTGSGPVALESLSLGVSELAALGVYAGSAGNAVYIAKDLTVTADANFTTAGNPYVTVFGDLIANGDVTLGSNTTLLGGLEAAAGKTVTTAGTTINLTTLRGAGTLELSSATSATILGGNGNVEVLTITPFNLGASTFGNTGSTAFSNATGALTVTGAVTFAGPVDFAADLTLGNSGAGKVTFGKPASFADGAVITGGTTGNTITLSRGGALTAADGGDILVNNSNADVVLTPGTATTLTFDATNKKITQGASSLTVTGTATLPTGASYVVGGSGVGLVLSENAAIAGAGKLTAGGTEIVGGWKAVGTGYITIINDTITASANTSILTGLSADSTITVAATAIPLEVADDTAINLADGGSIILVTAASNPGAIDLNTTTARIIGLTGGSVNLTLVTTAIANATYVVGTTTGQVVGSGSVGPGTGVIAGGNATGPNPISATVSAPANAVIDKDTLVGAN
jgi:hypothetical protein